MKKLLLLRGTIGSGSLWEVNSSKNKGIVQIHCGKKSYETRNSYCLDIFDRVDISRLE